MENNNNNQNLEISKQNLISTVERVCNRLRTKLEVNEYRDYVMAFLFYKYLSEKIENSLSRYLARLGISFKEFNDSHEKYNDIKNHLISSETGFFLDYNLTFQAIVEKINQGKNIIPDLEDAFGAIENSSKGTNSENDFKGLFQEISLVNSKIGETESNREEFIQNIIKEMQSLKLNFDNTEEDIFGTAYEYLLSEFASDGGKKAGEFYTPSSVAELISRIAISDRKIFKSAYDPACGSGSLLMKLVQKVGNEKFTKIYGQEVKQSTFNLARMNLFLRGMNFSKFDIRQGDTLINPKHSIEAEGKMDCIVANPPFSLKWNPLDELLGDERFNQYSHLAPKSYADFAFLQHMLHYVNPNGGIVVSVFSLGILERGNAEKEIRKVIVDRNYIDTIILLPERMFFNTSIPTCIVVARKDKKDKEILFIDASKEFESGKRQNKLSSENIDKIFNTWKNKEEIPHFSKRIFLDEVIHNDYSLSVSKYIEPEPEVEEIIDIEALENELISLDEQIKKLEVEFKENLNKYIEKSKKGIN